MNTSLRGRVVIAFRANSYCFWEIWAVPGSIPRWGTWFFFFVQIIFYLLFMNIHNIYTPNQVSKVLGNLSRITLPFWTVWTAFTRSIEGMITILCLALVKKVGGISGLMSTRSYLAEIESHCRDELELEFSCSSKPELWSFRAQPSQAEAHLNFWAETELKIF